MPRTVKIKKFLSREELPRFFRELADALEQGNEEGELVCVEDFSRIKLSIQDNAEQLVLKMKMKPQGECGDALEPSGTEKPEKNNGASAYIALKKRMKADFKSIFKLLHEGSMPPGETVRSFVADARHMVTCKGFGDEDYPEFTKAVNELEQAYQELNRQGVEDAAHRLAAQKGHCHARYA